MTRVIGIIAVCLTLTVSASRAQQPAESDEQKAFLATQRWVKAVLSHEPGKADQAVELLNGLTSRDRQLLNDGLPVFMATLAGKGVTTRSVEMRRIADLGADASRNPGTNPFLARAAVLHADAAMVAPYVVMTPTSPDTVPDVMSRGGMVAANDGQYGGVAIPNWSWAFGRRLLDQTLPGPAGDPFVASWYHATAAFMMQRGYLGEVAPHLDRAMQLFSNDARIVFDRACLAETLGLPRARQVLDDPFTRQALDNPNRQPGQVGRVSNNVVGRANPMISKLQTEAEAERLFRRALSLDPAMAEARVRLGRLYESNGRHADALTELAAGIAASKDEVTLFYAHLFAARASNALRASVEAAAHLEKALALFPRAQSALLAASQFALVHDDAGEALARFRVLAGSDPDTRGDPWWHYHSGTGRHADALLAELWASVQR